MRRKTLLVWAGVAVVCLVWAGLASWSSVLQSQPVYVQVGIPCLLIAAFAIPWFLDRPNLHAQTVSILITIVATFFGASIAFLQASLQGDIMGKSSLHDRIAAVMLEIDEAYGPFYRGTTIGANDVKRELFPALSSLLGSDQALHYLGQAMIAELVVAAALIRARNAELTDTRGGAVPKNTLTNYGQMIQFTYTRLCMLNVSYEQTGRFSGDLLKAPDHRLYSLFGPADPNVTLPDACRSPRAPYQTAIEGD